MIAVSLNNVGTANPTTGSQVLSGAQASALLAGLWYLNVHTTNFAGGEIRGQLVDTGCPQWTDLGLGKPGSLGTPVLVGDGALTAGSPNTVRLINGQPGSTANLVYGLSSLSAPFKGGTLVPFPDFLALGLPIDAFGGLALGFTWPVGVPAGVPVFAQYWVQDPGAKGGLSASNGMQLTAQ